MNDSLKEGIIKEQHDYSSIWMYVMDYMKRILIVEDDQGIRELLRIAFKTSHYQYKSTGNGIEALSIIDKEKFDLILLDVMLPEFDGFQIMEYIHPKKIPVIFITAKGDIGDRIKGLNPGADDYIVKPFDITELLARVNAVLRRCMNDEEVICFKNIKVDVLARTVIKDGKNIILTLKEFELLNMLARNKNIAIYREQLFEEVWNEPYEYTSRTLDLHIQKIRKKLDLQEEIQTVYKIGYKLVDV